MLRNKLTLGKGFTLMELMVTIAVASILVGIAVPSFTTSIQGSQITTLANDFVVALNYARSEAVRKDRQVTISATSMFFWI